jgi:hypothetical protein
MLPISGRPPGARRIVSPICDGMPRERQPVQFAAGLLGLRGQSRQPGEPLVSPLRRCADPIHPGRCVGDVPHAVHQAARHLEPLTQQTGRGSARRRRRAAFPRRSRKSRRALNARRRRGSARLVDRVDLEDLWVAAQDIEALVRTDPQRSRHTPYHRVVRANRGQRRSLRRTSP